MTDNKENANSEFGLTDSKREDTMNTHDNLNESTLLESDLSGFNGILDTDHGFRIGDVVWYHLDSGYAVKRSKVANIVVNNPNHMPYLIVPVKLVMENGDEVETSKAFHTKKEAFEHIIDGVTQSINQYRIMLANTQHNLGELERKLKVLQKHLSDAECKHMPEQKVWTYSDIYDNREEILAHPELYDRYITRFSAGGLGGCLYRKNVTISTLVRCWDHPEFRIPCPKCREESLVTMFAGSVNSGGYWGLRCYCPKCREEHYIQRPGSLAMRHEWRTLAQIAHECSII